MNRAFLLTALFLLTVHFPLYPATLSNAHLLAAVDDDTGRIMLATQDGLQQVTGDERRHLLFYDEPPSSYTLIYLDDDLLVFGGEGGEFHKRPVIIGNYIETLWGNDLIRVTQVVQFIRREWTGLEDGVLLRYEIENRSPKNMEAGIRVLFDTYLGERGPIHFSLAGGRDIEYETDLAGALIPSSWESRESEGTCLRGVLSGNIVTVPRKVVFANYKSLLEQPVLYRISENRRFHNLPYSRNDSAVALYFGPTVLEPGDSAVYSTILGLSGEGEYVLKGQRIIYEEKTAIPFLLPKAAPGKAPSRNQIEQVLREIENIEIIQGSLDRINELIAELNEALESDDVTISEERLADIRRILSEIAGE